MCLHCVLLTWPCHVCHSGFIAVASAILLECMNFLERSFSFLDVNHQCVLICLCGLNFESFAMKPVMMVLQQQCQDLQLKQWQPLGKWSGFKALCGQGLSCWKWLDG